MYLRICMDVYLLVSICFWIEAGGGRHRGPVSTCRGAAAGLWSIALLLIAFKWGLGGLGGGRGFLCSTSRFDQDCKHWFSLSPTSKMCNQADVIVVKLRTFLWSSHSTIMDRGQCAQRVHVVQFTLHRAYNDNIANWHVSRFTPDIIIDQLLWQTLNIFWWWCVDTVVVRCSFDKDVKAFVAFWWKRFVLTLSRPNIPGKSHILGKFNTITLKMEIILRMMMTGLWCWWYYQHVTELVRGGVGTSWTSLSAFS